MTKNHDQIQRNVCRYETQGRCRKFWSRRTLQLCIRAYSAGKHRTHLHWWIFLYLLRSSHLSTIVTTLYVVGCTYYIYSFDQSVLIDCLPCVMLTLTFWVGTSLIHTGRLKQEKIVYRDLYLPRYYKYMSTDWLKDSKERERKLATKVEGKPVVKDKSTVKPVADKIPTRMGETAQEANTAALARLLEFNPEAPYKTGRRELTPRRSPLASTCVSQHTHATPSTPCTQP